MKDYSSPNCPVQVLLDSDGYLVRAGDFDVLGKKEKKELFEVVASGGSVKTMTISEYRKTTFNWLCDKSKSVNQ